MSQSVLLGGAGVILALSGHYGSASVIAITLLSILAVDFVCEVFGIDF